MDAAGPLRCFSGVAPGPEETAVQICHPQEQAVTCLISPGVRDILDTEKEQNRLCRLISPGRRCCLTPEWKTYTEEDGRKLMKRWIALMLVLCALLSMTAGCGSQTPEATASSETTESPATSEATEATTQIPFEADDTPRMSEGDGGWKVHEDFSDGTWQLCEETDPLLVEVAIMMSGFAECNLASDKYVSDVHYYVKDGKAAVTFDRRISNGSEVSHWELHAAKSEEFINISGTPVGGGNTYTVHANTEGRGAGKLEHNWYRTQDGGTVVTAFAPSTGNVYSIYCDSYAGEAPYFPSGYDARTCVPIQPQYLDEFRDGKRGLPEKAYIGTFTIKLGDDGGTRQYQYRFGMSMSQWINSEYNTDGFSFDVLDPTTIVSPDGVYSYSDVLIFGRVDLHKQGSRTPSAELCNRLLCFNSESPLQLLGALLTGTEKDAVYRDNRVGRNWSNPGLGAHDDITIQLVVSNESLLDGMTIFLAPHSNNTTELPKNAEEYAFSRDTVSATEKGHVFYISNQPAAGISYKTGEMPGFDEREGFDIYALYNGEVIYKLWLGKFW